MEKRQLTFPIAWNGLIDGRAVNSGDQPAVLKTVFKVNFSSPDANNYISGRKRFDKGASIDYISSWEENPEQTIGKLRTLNIKRPEMVASAFHAYLLGNCLVGTVGQTEIDRAIASGDSIRYIGAVLYGALYNRTHFRSKTDILTRDEREYLRTLENKITFKNIFAPGADRETVAQLLRPEISDPYLKTIWGRLREKGEGYVSNRAIQLLRDMSPEIARLFEKITSVTFFTPQMVPIIYFRPGDNLYGWENYWPNIYFGILTQDIHLMQEFGILREGTQELQTQIMAHGSPFLFDKKCRTALVLYPSPQMPDHMLYTLHFGTYSYTSVGQELLPFFQAQNREELLRLGALIKRDRDNYFSIKAFHVATRHIDNGNNKQLKINHHGDLLKDKKADVLTDEELSRMLSKRNASHISVQVT